MNTYSFSHEIEIDGKTISKNSTCFTIAEAGVNHNGNFDNAKLLVDIASDSGVDAVKFQHFNSEELILKNVEMASYQKTNIGSEDSQFNMLKKLELTIDQLAELKTYTEAKGLIFLCTPFDIKSFYELESIGVTSYKISSSDVTNLELLKKVALTKKPIILSSGMCSLEEIDEVIKFLLPINPNIVLLHCTSNYPTKPSEVNLNVLRTLAERYNILVGFSDHTAGVGASPYALALGATIVEKHFTIDKNMEGPDHVASLDPDELKDFVDSIKYVEQVLGNQNKEIVAGEKGNKEHMQKYIVAKQNINKGDLFNEDNITTKRTGGKGVPALKYFEVIGKSSHMDLQVNDIVRYE